MLLTFCLAYKQRYLAASGVRHAVADLDFAGAAVGRGVSDLSRAHRAQHRRVAVQDADRAGAGRDVDVGYLRIERDAVGRDHGEMNHVLHRFHRRTCRALQ